MNAAFSESAADFSGIADSCELYISRILHKTYIEVGEEGTRAAAVTGVYLDYGGTYLEQPKIVSLDRPFVYLIYDVENSLPIFIGTLNDPS
jgi:serpin B